MPGTGERSAPFFERPCPGMAKTSVKPWEASAVASRYEPHH